MPRPAIFLDRDGTIIEDKGYLRTPEGITLLPRAAAALKQLQDLGFALFIVSNQSGIGRGYFTLAEAEAINRRLAEELAGQGVRLERIYMAPEAPDEPSRGRKPSPQFLFDARDEFGADLSRSYMIGDKVSDIECGRNAGVRRSILVRTGYGSEAERSIADLVGDHIVVDDLAAAAAWIATQT